MAIQGRSCELCGKDYTGTKTEVCTDGMGMKECGGDILPPVPRKKVPPVDPPEKKGKR